MYSTCTGNFFSRSLVNRDGQAVIESTCSRCETVITGSGESLSRDEDDHSAKCWQKPLAKSAD